MRDKAYIENIILPLVKKLENDELTNGFKEAIKYWNDEDNFNYDENYEGLPAEYIYDNFSDLIYNQDIKLKTYDIILDVGENKTKTKKIKDTFTFILTDIYDIDDIMGDDFFVLDNKGNFCINPDYDDGNIADKISDETDWLVYSFSYKIIVS